MTFQIALSPVRRAFHDFKRRPFTKHAGEGFAGLLESPVSLSALHLEWTDLVDDVVERIADVHRIEHAHAEVDGELEPGFARCGFDAVVLLEQKHAESAEAGIFERVSDIRLRTCRSGMGRTIRR